MSDKSDAVPAEGTVQREKVIDQKAEVTGRISDTCRVIGFGLLVFYFTIHFNDAETAQALRGQGVALYLIGAAGALTVLFDYLQYLFGSRAAAAALKSSDHLYDPESIAYRARNRFFQAKQATAGIGAVVVLYVMIFPNGGIAAICRVFGLSA